MYVLRSRFHPLFMKQSEALAKESTIRLASHKSCMVYFFFVNYQGRYYEAVRSLEVLVQQEQMHGIACAVSACELSSSTCFFACANAGFALCTDFEQHKEE